MAKTVITKLWPWHQPPNCAVITLRQIIEGDAPILLVTHDMDDHGWQFLSGQDIRVEDSAVVALSEIAERDPSVIELADMPPGWRAWRRSVSDPWMREIVHRSPN